MRTPAPVYKPSASALPSICLSTPPVLFFTLVLNSHPSRRFRTPIAKAKPVVAKS
ncbi:uncharacterized protein N7506_005657 [Penicillium brevicompactum]|uniref:uncharacterized protein n=1 Tax=Penicillium brevicompactum TaxID=5074 RepID=UPI00253F77E0|nr:uncharacterized protein N7506_005657 [Penicillium brevicompactum]KAJ5335721.1 hypothetical protein N7506_005657 [Penicillium brevicompactum]